MKVAQLLGLQGPWQHGVCRDTDCLHHRSYGPVIVFFSSVLYLVIGRPLWLVFLHSSSCSGSERAPLPGVLLYCSAHQADREDNWLGSYSVNWHVRHLKGTLSGSYSIVSSHSLYCSASNAGMWGREAMVMAPPPTGDSAVSPCFYGCPAFLHRHFQPQPPPLHPLDLSLHSQQQPLP